MDGKQRETVRSSSYLLNLKHIILSFGIKPDSHEIKKDLTMDNLMFNIIAIRTIFWEGLMEVTITLTDKEVFFLQRMIAELNTYQKKQTSLEDAIHQCIQMASYEESEEGS